MHWSRSIKAVFLLVHLTVVDVKTKVQTCEIHINEYMKQHINKIYTHHILAKIRLMKKKETETNHDI